MKEFKLERSPIVYYISEEKNKEWVLFIHAAFVNYNMFLPQIEYFKNKYNILAIDIIGHGNSTDAKKGDSIKKMSAWISEILKVQGIDKVHIVGISLGAVLAQDFANKYPHFIKSLACFGGYDINNFDIKMHKKNSAAQMSMMLKAMISVRWFAKSNMNISAYSQAAQRSFYEMNVKFPKRSFMYLASLNSMINVHKTQKREYPLLIGCGKYDLPMELSAIEMWKRNEPDCQVAIFENAGHCVNMDVPQKFNETLEKFWEKGSGGIQ